MTTSPIRNRHVSTEPHHVFPFKTPPPLFLVVETVGAVLCRRIIHKREQPPHRPEEEDDDDGGFREAVEGEGEGAQDSVQEGREDSGRVVQERVA